jgi:hypothetical protein
MEQRDYLENQIEQLGRALGKVLPNLIYSLDRRHKIEHLKGLI